MSTKRVLYSLAILSLVVGLLPGYSPASAQSSGNFEITRDTLFVPGEVVVGFAQGLSRAQYTAQASALAGDVGAQVVDQYGNMALLSFAEDTDVASLAAQIGGVQGVAYAEPNYISWIPEQNPLGQAHEVSEITFKVSDPTSAEHTQETISVEELRSMRSLRRAGRRIASVPTYPSDPWLYEAWGWWLIDADIIWPERRLSPTVCVLDTGIDIRHPDLIGMALNGKDFVNDDLIAEDDNGHGTHVAGTIAARMNNKKGIAGVSNGRVLGVKVLSAQGWGTSFDIASGIVYCANRYDVKTINMSLGGYDDSLTEFNALEYAIVTKGKLAVAAAGNDGTSNFFFPAAWASPFVCANGSDTYPSICGSNTIHQGLISVGAALASWSDDYDVNLDNYLWIDSDGDSSEPNPGDSDFLDEHALFFECATDFSNYGVWVELVAPGVDILSTLPTSYMYWENYFQGADFDGDGYDWWSGTSMSASYAAGAAARLWSLYPLDTNTSIHDRLISSGRDLNTMMDPNMASPENGYASGGYSGEAPFCWPDATKGGIFDMNNAKYLNVARAMDRAMIQARVNEAVTGLPLAGATVYAYDGIYLRDMAKVSTTSAWVTLLNLPDWRTYNLKVMKPRYTAGLVLVCWLGVYDPGLTYYSPECNLAIPPIGRITAVLNWMESNNLDLYTWLPNVSSIGGVVGAGYSGSDDLGPGDLSDFPRARWNRDGGNTFGGDSFPIESITIVQRPGYVTTPYYNLTSGDYYNFLVTDYGTGDLNDYVILRMWAGGKIFGVSVKGDYCDTDGPDNIPGGLDAEWWWHAGYLNYGTFASTDVCGTTIWGINSVWPYAEGAHGTAGIPERPSGK